MLAGGCSKSRSPAAAYQQIRQETQSGHLDAAFSRVTKEHDSYKAKDPYWELAFRVQKSHILFLRGSISDSLQLLNPNPPPALSHSEPAVRRKLVQGLDYTVAQRYGDARRALDDAQSQARSFQPSVLGDVALARGNLEWASGNYSAAEAEYRSARDIARQQNLPYLEINSAGDLGNVAMKLEHYDEAIEWFKLALAKSEALQTLFSMQLSLGNIGWNYSVVGDFDSAEAMLKQAEETARRAGMTGNRIYWLNALGDVYYQQHRYTEAEAASSRALDLARNRDDKNTVTECLNTLSEIELATGNLDLAEKHNQEAAAIENAGLDRSGVQFSQVISGRIAAGKKQFAQAEAAFQKILADPSAETSLKWQAESRLAQVYAAENQPAQAEREFRRAINTIREAQNSLHREEFRVSFLAGAIQFYDAYIDFLVSRGRHADALAVADLSRARALEQGLAEPSRTAKIPLSSPDPRKLAARFRSTLLFYSLGEQHSYLWVITPAEITLVPLPPENEISPLVASYKESILNSPDDPLASPDSAGAKLYSLLVAPAAKFIPQSSRVILFSDGALDTFNFETLVVPSPHPHFWIEDVTITNANSLALLARSNAAAAPRNPSLLLVGNPVPADSSFPALPQAAAEISDVESYFPRKSRVLLTGAAATPAAYLASDPAQYAYLHFVTHGIASRLQPLESAVVLSPSGDSYKLYAREIITRPLHAYLVTVSACNGAGNRAYAGEGLVGLSWAFLRAGAHHVISALWEVSDVSTPQLMNSLYEGLHRGEDPAAALRNAKLRLLHSNSIYKKPFYWAPFQLYSGS